MVSASTVGIKTLPVPADGPRSLPTVAMLIALPFILFCVAFVVIGYLRAPRGDEPLPSLSELGIHLLRIQVFGFVAALIVAFFADRDLAVAVFLAGQGWAVLTLLLHGLSVALSRR